MDKQEFLSVAAIAAMQGILSCPEPPPSSDDAAKMVAVLSWDYARALWEQRPEEAK